MPKFAVLAAANIEGKFYPAGAVVEVSDKLAAPLKAQGYLDASKEAIAHRESSGEAVKKHVAPEVATDPGADQAEKR